MLKQMPIQSQPFEDGVYRTYNVTLSGDEYVYAAAGRFQIANGSVSVLEDPTGILKRL